VTMIQRRRRGCVQGELFYLSFDLYELIALLINFLEPEDFVLKSPRLVS
jgi:hypothetical protein